METELCKELAVQRRVLQSESIPPVPPSGSSDDAWQRRLAAALRLSVPCGGRAAKRRLGPRSDGGYVVWDDGQRPLFSALLSYGADTNVDFEWELAMTGTDVLLFDHTVEALPRQHPKLRWRPEALAAEPLPGTAGTLEEHLEQLLAFADGARIALKADVEGAEFAAILSTPEKVLSRFDQICLELHWLGRPMRGGDYETKARALEKLAEQFVLLHAHGNSYGDILNVAGCQLPDVLEVLYVHKRLLAPGSTAPSLKRVDCPAREGLTGIAQKGLLGYMTDIEGKRKEDVVQGKMLLPASRMYSDEMNWRPGRRVMFNADLCCNFRVEASDTLKEAQRKNEQLRARLRKSPWPELRLFSSRERSYSLPLRAEGRELPHLLSESVLTYLAGFFDGDGCVSCAPDLSGCYLSITQSFNQAEVLMLFRETFAGSISLHRDGMGLQKPSLRWTVGGQSARNAAQLLVPHSITKCKQLVLAAGWPNAKSCREGCKTELRALKENDSAVAGPCSWEYFAGFFDAEGYIQQRNGRVSLDLQIGQKHPRVLKCLREFVARGLGIDATLRKMKRDRDLHALEVSGLLKCKRILQHLLNAGLLCKAKQAQLAVGLTPGNAQQVSDQLSELTGNQTFGKRLDAAGRERAKKIRSAQAAAARLKRRGQFAEAVAKLGEVEVLKHEHELLKACCENKQLMEPHPTFLESDKITDRPPFVPRKGSWVTLQAAKMPGNKFDSKVDSFAANFLRQMRRRRREKQKKEDRDCRRLVQGLDVWEGELRRRRVLSQLRKGELNQLEGERKALSLGKPDTPSSSRSMRCSASDSMLEVGLRA
ncbi:unnamed protein product [Symbiodinium sp. KB8]|nr:unnamed protein product [Symbiodinium sp. KB8]